jgi:DNA-binding MarR family transcriptional regulator
MPRAKQQADDYIEQTITAWRRERPGLDLSGMAVVARLLRVAHRFDEAQDEFFAALGLKPGWLDVLAALRRSGEPYTLTPTRLAEEALISTAGMTNRLDRLEQAGLVRRLRDPDDRRGIQVELTNKGKGLYEDAIGVQGRKESLVAAALTNTEKKQLNALLRRLMIEFERAEGGPPPEDC